jgi:hypothetical protein
MKTGALRESLLGALEKFLEVHFDIRRKPFDGCWPLDTQT